MKLAHLILAYNYPMQLERLVKRLNHQNADVYIHLDLKTDIAAYTHLKSLPNTFFVTNRVNVKWGEYSVIQATLNGLEQILATENTYSHINLLSGHDYPLQSTAHIHRFLFANTDKSFMAYDLIVNDWVHGQARMNYYYLGEYGFPGRYQLAVLLNKVLPKRKLPGDIKGYGRSQWFTITPACAEYVVRYIRNHPDLHRFFKMTWAVDEVFFQTILCNSPLANTLVNDNLRHIILQPDFRPHVFSMADAGELSATPKFYARKFDLTKDSDIFDYLDKKADL